MSSTWCSSGSEFVDIGGDKLGLSLDKQLAEAFSHNGYFPKEIAYTDGMKQWYGIAGSSYQTTDEVDIIEATAAEIVAALPSGTSIIDLGAANSKKFEPYVQAFIAQGKSCTYVPLDLNKESLIAQVRRAKASFPNIDSVGLWGDFDAGDKFYSRIATPKLFLSLGSIFFNAPDEMCDDRCTTFKAHLGVSDRLIVGQDGPSDADRTQSHASYSTAQYEAFLKQYLRAIMARAGIQEVSQQADPLQAWNVDSKSVDSKHYFEVTAKVN